MKTYQRIFENKFFDSHADRNRRSIESLKVARVILERELRKVSVMTDRKFTNLARSIF